MNDQHVNETEFDAALRTWMQEAPTEQPDRSLVVGNVVRQLGTTRRRRRRRWPFSFSRRTASSGTQATPERRSSPIQAANGHSATAIGRTQTMFSPAKAITAGALVFAIGGAMLIAQPFGQQGGTVPGAAIDDFGPAAYVHGTMTGYECCGDAVETFDDDGSRLTMRGMASSGVVDMDDPRLSGAWELTINLDEFPQLDDEQRVEVQWGDLTIANDDGSWNGTWISTYDSAAATETSLWQYRLTGEGAYEGLSALLSPTSHEWPSWTVAGAVFPGPLPPESAYDE